MKIKTITLVETNSITFCPPDINLIQNLLKNGYMVNLVSNRIDRLKKEILNHPNFYYFELDTVPKGNTTIEKLGCRIRQIIRSRRAVRRFMEKSDLLWTTSENSVRDLGDLVFKYKHVFQLMELTYRGNYWRNIITFDLSKIARHAWRVVVPEINRAYIMKTWYKISKAPYVLPNKPYSLELGDITDEMILMLEKMKNEKRKIILYLGGIWGDRNLEPVAKAINLLGADYCLYIIGKAYGEKNKKMLDYLLKKYPIEYVGNFVAPKHLHFVKYAHIGLLAYKPIASKDLGVELNALYCAPNKIYEYAAYGVPMIGTDVLGLRHPFEKYGIGRIYEENIAGIIKAVKDVEDQHEEMSTNCRAFYEECDLDKIVENILSDE